MGGLPGELSEELDVGEAKEGLENELWQGQTVRASNATTAYPIYSITICSIYSVFKHIIF